MTASVYDVTDAPSRPCEYNGGTCTRDGCAAGCQVLDILRNQTAMSDALNAAAGAEAVEASGWVRLADSDWVNIVNAPSVLDPFKDKEEAVREAVKLTEAKLKQLNTNGVGVTPHQTFSPSATDAMGDKGGTEG